MCIRDRIFATLGTLEEVDGGVLLHSQTDDLNWLARELARLPFAFAIREPKELGGAVGRHASALAAAANATISRRKRS